MQLDLLTMSAVNVTVTAMLGAVLLLTWARERESPLIGWWGLALLLQAIGLAMMSAAPPGDAGRLFVLGGAVIILGEGVKWKAAREFAHLPAGPFLILLGSVAFLLAAQSGYLQSLDYRLDALCVVLSLYNFATAFQFARAAGEQPASRWPAVILLVIVGLGYVSWLPFNLAMPIRQAQWVATSIWFPPLILLTLLMRVAIAVVVLSLAKERSAMDRRIEALTDSLTGLPNRRALFEAADALVQEREVKGGPISVLIFDLDHFKETNDRFGHDFGDRVLKLFASTLRAHVGSTSIVARLGGEEFAAILAGADPDEAVKTGEAVRHRYGKSAAFIDGLAVGATVSVGAASDVCGGGDLNALFRRADAALYAAKRAGRNRVELSAPERESATPAFKSSVRAKNRKISGEPAPPTVNARRA